MKFIQESYNKNDEDIYLKIITINRAYLKYIYDNELYKNDTNNKKINYKQLVEFV